MRRVGWRLTLEPCADMVAWSLLRRDDARGSAVGVWSGLIRDAAWARERTDALTSDATPGLLEPTTEAIGARELGSVLLPAILRRALASGGETSSLTICARGWLSRVPWDSLAVNQDGLRVVERCQVMGGLAPGLLADTVSAAEPRATAGAGQLWIVDPGPPDGRWGPLYPAGYPEPLARLVEAPDRLLPDGALFPADELSRVLRAHQWRSFLYVGHIAAPRDSPATASLVLSAPDGVELLSAHDWLREPERWPAPGRVALLGCGSDDADSFEQSGLITAALGAGAESVAGTRWSLPNRGGVLRILEGVAGAFARPALAPALRRWQLEELDRWRRTADPESSPAYWSALVVYDRQLAHPDGGHE